MNSKTQPAIGAEVPRAEEAPVPVLGGAGGRPRPGRHRAQERVREGKSGLLAILCSPVTGWNVYLNRSEKYTT